ncbi:YbaB/EbfC family nucleoid-associated protein [Streptomyces sp. B3I8]|uniref:YbaB/EbfC family nucleoid-associated protein n=1 Tax=Streptomyces sp. B3I8 TaxID=3042303 RepID=UPI002785E14E|nr:YbaB/EbfC family nucleoid-associated protein [Streptomyces sp. B3I8]MDQ0786675.1 DNA-binding protein YbaB [Streptomyces sp. B3I8]
MTASLGSHRPNMQAFMEQIRQTQASLLATQQELIEKRFEGSCGGGAVRAIVDGSGRLREVIIAEEAADPEDTDNLSSLLITAIREATLAAQESAMQELLPTIAGTIQKNIRANVSSRSGTGAS